MRTLRRVPLVLALVVGGCGAQPAKDASGQQNVVPTSKRYSQTELGRLTLCMGFGDVLFHAAMRKAGGSTQEQELARLDQGPRSDYHEFLKAVVAIPYQKKQIRPEDFTAFYRECSREFAEIPTERAEPAVRCLRAQHVALETCFFHTQGISRERVLNHFRNVPFAPAIVDRAFALADPSDYVKRADVVSGEFKRCFAEADGT